MERFENDARQAIIFAQDEARRLRHGCIGTEHILIGLADEPSSPAGEMLAAQGLTRETIRRQLGHRLGTGLDSDALASVGINLTAMRQAAEKRFGAGALDHPSAGGRPAVKGHIPFSQPAKAAVGAALHGARSLGAKSINSGHLLLGLMTPTSDLADLILDDFGVDVDELRSRLQSLLNRHAA